MKQQAFFEVRAYAMADIFDAAEDRENQQSESADVHQADVHQVEPVAIVSTSRTESGRCLHCGRDPGYDVELFCSAAHRRAFTQSIDREARRLAGFKLQPRSMF